MRYKLNIQRFAGPIPYSITVNGEDFTIVRTRDDINTTWEIDQSANSTLYSINNSKVIWKNGGILQYNGVDVLPTDLINADSAYTTRASEPTTGKNNLRLGSITPKGYYLGTEKVIKMYLGSTLIYELSSLPQLATPQNVSVEDTTLSFDEVENAEEYEVFVDNVSIGSYTKPSYILTSDSINPANIEVNGTALTSLPYTLQSGDVIIANLMGMEDSALTVNGVKQTSNNQTFTLTNTDIAVELESGSFNGPKVTINYQ